MLYETKLKKKKKSKNSMNSIFLFNQNVYPINSNNIYLYTFINNFVIVYID